MLVFLGLYLEGGHISLVGLRTSLHHLLLGLNVTWVLSYT